MHKFAVDTHFHVWKLKEIVAASGWPDEGTEIYKDFSLDDYAEAIKDSPVEYSIFVQCQNRAPEEAVEILEQCCKYPFLKGVVAGVDLEDKHITATLERLGKY